MSSEISSKLSEEVAKIGKTGCQERFKHVKRGDWRTLEVFWNVPPTTCFFKKPSGAEIKLQYGVGIFGKESQKQKLDGINIKKIEIGRVSVVLARLQIKVKESTDVLYEYCPHFDPR